MRVQDAGAVGVGCREIEGIMFGQLMLWETGPVYLCDKCRWLVRHASGDGYCCCLAPGMGHIRNKSRKPLGAECAHFRRKDG